MSIYGYSRPTTPRIDSWFKDGLVFESAYATAASTSPSIVSALTGLLPQDHGVRLFYQKISPEIPTVADTLSDAGFQTAAVVSNIVLTSEAIGLDARFDHYDDFVDEREPNRSIYERRASRTTDAALAWLSDTRDPARPSLLWVHYIDPHGPYRPPADRPSNFTHSSPILIDIQRVPAYEREPGVDDGAEYVDLYDEEIAYVDREIGRLLDGFTRLGLARNSLVVLTADHGESMMEHDLWFTHGYQVYEEIARIPMLIWAAGIEAGRVSHPVSLADVAPTLLTAAGVEIPSGLYGRPLGEARPDRRIFSEAFHRGYQWRAMWRQRKKWMVMVKHFSQPEPETAAAGGARPKLQYHRYYDLELDPQELKATPWRFQEKPTKFLELIRSDSGTWEALDPTGYMIRAPKVAPGVDSKTLERLRSLGYVR